MERLDACGFSEKLCNLRIKGNDAEPCRINTGDPELKSKVNRLCGPP
jgi:hypothetical protein